MLSSIQLKKKRKRRVNILNKYKSIEEIVDYFQARYNEMADQADGVPTAITSEMIDLVHLEMCKQVNEVTAQEKFIIKCKNKMYKKLLNAKRNIATAEKADAWFDKVFQKYFNRGILEHLIVYAINFLHKKDLLVAKRLFKQINNDELLAEIATSACDYLGWTSQNEPIVDETETIDEQQQETDENAFSDEETAQNDEQCTDVVVYEAKELQPIEQQAQPLVKVERTVTHEVMTATQGTIAPVTQGNEEVAANDDEGQGTTPNGTKKVPPSFFRPGGKSGNNF